ncbi:hypothetical protein ACTI_45340 [Actinoplanes sp. OR16]|nr:hypothetical protein ACTI_45340 [Actinoplanes sp. OR16]
MVATIAAPVAYDPDVAVVSAVNASGAIAIGSRVSWAPADHRQYGRCRPSGHEEVVRTVLSVFKVASRWSTKRRGTGYVPPGSAAHSLRAAREPIRSRRPIAALSCRNEFGATVTFRSRSATV